MSPCSCLFCPFWKLACFFCCRFFSYIPLAREKYFLFCPSFAGQAGRLVFLDETVHEDRVKSHMFYGWLRAYSV